MPINSFPIPTKQINVSSLARTSQLRQTEMIVKTLADLPDPVDGIISIPDDTMISPDGMVDITPNALQLGVNCSIIGTDPGKDIIMTDRVGPAIISNGDLGQRIFRQFVVINNSGSALEVTTTQDVHINLYWIGVLGSTSFGTLSGGRVIAVKSCYQGKMDIPGVGSFLPVSGVSIGGSIAKLLVSDTPFEDMQGEFTAVTLNSTLNCDAADIRGNYFKGTGGNGVVLQETGAFVGTGIFTSNVITAGVVATMGFDGATPEWDFSDNTGIRNSATTGSLSMDGNTLATTVTTQNEWVKVNGVTASSFLERFSEDQNNRLMYVGVRPVDILCLASLTARGSSNNQVVEFSLFVNGTQYTPPMKTILTGPDAVSADSATLNTLVTMHPSDYIEVWGRCTSGANDFTVESIQFTVKG